MFRKNLNLLQASRLLETGDCDYITRANSYVDWLILGDKGLLARGPSNINYDGPVSYDLNLSLSDIRAYDWECNFF
jgi:hypothetical protein